MKVELVLWATGKNRLMTSMTVFLARWAKLLSWKQVSVIFGVSWDTVYDAVACVADDGLKHRELSGIRAIGMDAWYRDVMRSRLDPLKQVARSLSQHSPTNSSEETFFVGARHGWPR